MSSSDKIEQIPIAIVGIGCFFPKAAGLKRYWRMLSRGLDGITDVPADRWSPQDYYDPDTKASDRVCCFRGGFLSPIPFDPTEWGIPPNALQATDTSQLLALVAAKQALSDAGYGGGGKSFDRERTGVILGITGAQELVIPLGARLDFPKWRRALESVGIAHDKATEVIERIAGEYVEWQENSFPGLLGNVVAGRICNRLNLSGTNCVVDAACASSMAAVHMAVMELATRRSDMVLTGGVDTFNDIFMHMCFAKTNILSPSGDARPFSADADGTVLGEGVGIVVLKRLPDAEKDKDRIYGVIRGIGTASDGKSQSIYAPRPEGQAKALRKAYGLAGIDPASVQLIEAHGTGTRVGDAVEFSALREVFSSDDRNRTSISIGSVKSMIGHTKAAAGTAGLIKLALALYHKVLPPTLKVSSPDPKLQIETTPFCLDRDARPWIGNDHHPRRAGLSSFGFGGSNYHAVLEEYDHVKTDPAWDGTSDIFAFSADTPDLLASQVQRLIDTLPPDATPELTAYCAAQSRMEFKTTDRHRLLVQTAVDQPADEQLHATLKQAVTALQSGKPLSARSVYYGNGDRKPQIAFVFPGQGSQYIGMGRDLMCIFPEAFQVLQAANAELADLGRISDIIFPPTPRNADGLKQQRSDLNRTELAQPAMGTVCVAMLNVLQRFGIEPDVACGHSFGELVALHAAGAYDLTTLLKLARLRGQLMAAANGQKLGAMLAVNAPLKDIHRLIKENRLELVLANRNSPIQGVLSGPLEAIQRAETLCGQLRYKAVRLSVSAAFHSPLMSEVRRPFRTELDRIDIQPPKFPVYANTTGDIYPSDAAGIRDLLESHMLEPVNFLTEVENLYRAGVRTFIEVGPKTVMTGLIGAILDGRRFSAVPLDRTGGRGNNLKDLAAVLCGLAADGHPIELNRWEALQAKPRLQNMQIQISGANVWQPKPLLAGLSANPTKTRQPAGVSPNTGDDPPAVHRIPQFKPEPPNGQPPPMKPNDPFSTSSNQNALAVVQAGLNAMQSLHQQTAQAHQKFLDTQKEATRTLQQMMDQTQALMTGMPAAERPAQHPGSDIQTAAEPVGVTDPIPNTDLPSFSAMSATAPPLPDAPPRTPPDQPAFQQVTTDTAKAATEPAAPANFTDTLLAVVSELTGYPVEMIGLDMDIESDLGIDSIKRVEILSTMEERVPDLPAVPPEDLGSMKTLAQIRRFLAEQYQGPADGPDHIDTDRTVSSTPLPDSQPAAATPTATLPSQLLAVVSELTGYPVEMIGMEMDIEADLGIDSIKRVEILSTLEERIPDLPALPPENLGSLKTLKEITQALDQNNPSADRAKSIGQTAAADASDAAAPAAVEVSRNDPVNRQVVSLVEKALLRTERRVVAKGRKVFITDDKTGLSKAIADELAQYDINTVLISADILSHKDKLPSAGGLILVYGPDSRLNAADMKTAFGLVQHVGPDLLEASRNGCAILGAVVRLDSGFGHRTGIFSDPFQGGIAGLVKTAAVEWPQVACRVIDVAPRWMDQPAAAKAVADELLCAEPNSMVEVGLDADHRCEPILKSAAVSQNPDDAMDLALGPDDVVVVSGGARGITPAVLSELVKHCRPKLVLLGRTPSPSPEPDWLIGLDGEKRIKEAILQHEFRRAQPSPADVNRSYNRHIANRQVMQTLDELKRSGAAVSYHSIDICDTLAVKELLAEVHRHSGPIRALIHGAGVLKDRLIIDKSISEFDTVFDTKVGGLQSMLAAIPENDLRYLILFSSVAARFGNRGQADYAMANEVLNKMAWQLANRLQNCRVRSINWGPWDGGMVTASLKREFERRGVSLIPPAQGARCMVAEMADTSLQPAEVIIGGPLSATPHQPVESPQLSSAPSPVAIVGSKGPLEESFKQDVDLKRFPVIGDHQLDGQAVIPLALMAEWFGHGALHENPGLYLHGLDDMRVLQGIKLDRSDTRTIRLMASKARKNGPYFEVDLELRDGHQDGIDVVHSKARAVLSETIAAPPAERLTVPDAGAPYSRDIRDVYAQVLFHGEKLRGINQISHLNAKSMVAQLSPAPAPSEWIENPLRNRWIADPLIIDSAFQMASLWCYEQMGMVSLPSYCQSYRQYVHRFPETPVTAILEIDQAGRNKIKGNITFLAADHTILATISGFEAVADDSLYRAFKPQQAKAS